MRHRNIFHNCIQVKETEHGLLACRFTDVQLAYYRPMGAGVMERVLATSGVCLSFVTDQDVVSFDFFINSFARSPVCFDVWENGRYVLPIRFADETKTGTVTYQRRQSPESTVTIYLPCTCETYISSINFGAYKSVEPRAAKLLTIGDSIMQGMNGVFPSVNHMTTLANRLGCYMVNQGVGGRYYDAESFDEATDYEANVVLFALGSNDINVFKSAEKVAENAVQHIRKAQKRYPSAQFVMVTPVWRYDIEADPALKALFYEITRSLEQVGRENGCRTICGLDLVAHSEAYFGPHNAHLNDLGFAQYALSLIGALKDFSH